MNYLRKHESLFIFLGVLTTLFFEVLGLTLILMPKALAKNNEKEEYIPVIYREQITVKSLIEKFNEEIVNEGLYEIDYMYLTNKEEVYYIGLFQDVLLFVSPVEFSDVDNDIVYQTGIIIGKDSPNYELAKKYYNCLIKVNNELIYDIDDLINKTINNDGIVVDDNNGLLLAYYEEFDEINFVIERKYND